MNKETWRKNALKALGKLSLSCLGSDEEHLRAAVNSQNRTSLALLAQIKGRAEQNSSCPDKLKALLKLIVSDWQKWKQDPLSVFASTSASSPTSTPQQSSSSSTETRRTTNDAYAYVVKFHSMLHPLCAYACSDATRFGCKDKIVLERENEAETEVKRKLALDQAKTVAGGKRSYTLKNLRTCYEKSIVAKAGVCTTFAMMAAHILSNGSRGNRSKMRVEIFGVNRGHAATHIFAVVGRPDEGWGDSIFVDIWTASFCNNNKYIFNAKNFPYWDGTSSVSSFFDSWKTDPQQQDRQNTSSSDIDKQQEQRRKQQEAKREADEKPAWAR